jgi:hypothetical protein
MAEENLICPSCQAVMRQRALFCYKCGASIVSNSSAKSKKSGNKKTAKLVKDVEQKEGISNVWFQDKIVEETAKEQIEEPTPQIEEPTASELPVEVKIASTPSMQEKAKLETAASMRQKAKTIQKNRIEVVWEKPETPNIQFLLGTLIFATIAAGIAFIAWTLR